MRNLITASVAVVTLLLGTACSKKDKISDPAAPPAENCTSCGELSGLRPGEKFVTIEANGKKVTLIQSGDRYKLDPDVYLSDRQLAILKGEYKGNEDGRTAGPPTFIQLWPSRTVYYTLHWNLANPQVVEDAIAHWEDRTNLEFVLRTNQPNFIEFKTDENNACWSESLGMKGGLQKVNISAACSVGNAIHEIGHAIGFYHELTRRDRDYYVNINWANIRPDWVSQYQTYLERGIPGFEIGQMDFLSIMMYGSNGGSSAWDPAIPVWTDLNGNTHTRESVLSDGDVQMYNLLYNPPNIQIVQLNKVRVQTPEGRGFQWEDELRITTAFTWPWPLEIAVWVHESNYDGSYYTHYEQYTLQPGQTTQAMGEGWQINGSSGEYSYKRTAATVYQ
ncbi:M12 family metallopeptidase [Chitinophaga barathri]|uniref:Peptidase M12A domain-containing protein n=1 Tax=Chitinophaga barathri TaxID=1647451 RepID=A0A3N4MUB1_9BACT|nr:M12 family metallopeptidase [Chitinophaga barathri]RPD43159.1 hypothetical protein EG028_02360 [Chitinophaga barathri]